MALLCLSVPAACFLFTAIKWHCSFAATKVLALRSLSGGEALEASTSAAKQAAAEASTGAWLRELEEAQAAGAPPPRVCAPGLPRGAFGAWAVPEAGRPPGTPRTHKGRNTMLQVKCRKKP